MDWSVWFGTAPPRAPSRTIRPPPAPGTPRHLMQAAQTPGIIPVCLRDDTSKPARAGFGQNRKSKSINEIATGNSNHEVGIENHSQKARSKSKVYTARGDSAGQTRQSSNISSLQHSRVAGPRSRTTSPTCPETRAEPASVPMVGAPRHRSPRGHPAFSIFAPATKRELAADILLQSKRSIKIHEDSWRAFLSPIASTRRGRLQDAQSRRNKSTPFGPEDDVVG